MTIGCGVSHNNTIHIIQVQLIETSYPEAFHDFLFTPRKCWDNALNHAMTVFPVQFVLFNSPKMNTNYSAGSGK
jgi:hypothetical protein